MAWFFARSFGMPATVCGSRTRRTPPSCSTRARCSPVRAFSCAGSWHSSARLENSEAVALLEGYDDGTERLLLSRSADGTAYQMPIGDTRDMAAGVVPPFPASEPGARPSRSGPRNRPRSTRLSAG